MISAWVSRIDTVFRFSRSFLLRVFRLSSPLNWRSSSATRCSEFLSRRLRKAGSSWTPPASDIGLLISWAFVESSAMGVLGQRGDAVARVVSLTLLLWWFDLEGRWGVPDSVLFVRPCRTAFETRRSIDEEPSSVPSIRAISSSMLKSPPALHRGSFGEWPFFGDDGSLADSLPA